jgi:EAL domain-containing protein (putative c-di-GMP-specific phosphodiesterase class I)
VDGLRALGCSAGQGFLFAPPLTAEDLTRRLGRGQDQDRPAARPAGG